MWGLIKEALSILNNWLSIKKTRASFDLEVAVSKEYNEILKEISNLRSSPDLDGQYKASTMVELLEARLTHLKEILYVEKNPNINSSDTPSELSDDSSQ